MKLSKKLIQQSHIVAMIVDGVNNAASLNPIFDHAEMSLSSMMSLSSIYAIANAL